MSDDPQKPSTEAQASITLPANLLAGLDHACAQEADRPSRQDLATRILADWLRARGHLRARGCDEGKRPEELTTGNDD
ncbi:MAG: hypothetical protein JJU21_02875 [Salinarimonas sp.]|nr:hypothetical protein [Salinarimonas sp.]